MAIDIRSASTTPASTKNADFDLNYFILVAVDADGIDGRMVAALDLTEHRLRSARWPMYKRTHNQKLIRKGDVFLIYVGGHKRTAGNIIATAELRDIVPFKYSDDSVDPEDALTDTPSVLLLLTKINRIAPVSLRELILEMSIAPKNKQKWGIALMGGCRRITTEDFELFRKCADQNTR